MAPKLQYTVCPSVLGWVVLAASRLGLCMLRFCGPSRPLGADTENRLREDFPGMHVHQGRDSSLLDQARAALHNYYEHQEPIPLLPLDMSRGTAFQRQVWRALCRIPFGQTRTYADIAAAVGRPRAARAVGQACGRNPLALIVPCHRVVGHGGRLGGYTGGIHIKQTLLGLEEQKSKTGAQNSNPEIRP